MVSNEQKIIKQHIKDLKVHMNKMLAYRATANEATRGFLDALEEEHTEELNKLKLKLKLLEPRKEGDGLLTPNDIASAKTIPIKNFIKVPPSNKSVCLFHSDNIPSMHVYGTTYHCFSCGAHGTTIDIIMKIRNCNFTSAVKFLLNK